MTKEQFKKRMISSIVWLKESRIPALLSIFVFLFGMTILLGLVAMTPSKSSSLYEIPLNHIIRAVGIVLLPLYFGVLICYKCYQKEYITMGIIYLVFCLLMSVSIGLSIYGIYSRYFYEVMNPETTSWEMIDYYWYLYEVRRKASFYSEIGSNGLTYACLFTFLYTNMKYSQKNQLLRSNHNKAQVYPKPIMPIEEEKDLW
jgi:phosphotransferase system  glucose/maltose/N-acetylglucosamine-specific IIC component